MALSPVAWAQTSDVYWVNYYTNRNAANPASVDAHVRIINPGVQGTPLSVGEGAICADIYVFDKAQEMLECCSCAITANGMNDESVFTTSPRTCCSSLGRRMTA